MRNLNVPMYDPEMVRPMREELTRLGFEELRTPQEVAAVLAIQNERRPPRLVTVFAGQDADATTRARSYFTGYAPSSPQIALFKDGRLVFMLERRNIEGRNARDIAADLTAAFDRFC